ncbi:Na+/Ca+ antiporter, CaCA family [sediment metagenome]|uniref:Na+/Ca+ antiporter, CaCA family n=1 Tax=sediment metagenome TaxID=749907 RepID=D9PKS7_9ZZZZ
MGINSVINKQPQIFVGNLIGASIVLFIFIIPLLAIFGNGIKITHQLKDKDLVFALFVVSTPVFLIADNLVTRTEAILLILVYVLLVYFMERSKGLIERIRDEFNHHKTHFLYDISLVILGFIVIFLSSRFIVTQTISYSALLNIPPFVMSIIFLSLGTNLPELSIALRAVLLGKKDVALGDYIGSAAANTVIFGFLTLMNFSRIYLDIYSFKTMFFMLAGLSLFYFFSKSKNTISRKEGYVLLFFYILFIISEIVN